MDITDRKHTIKNINSRVYSQSSKSSKIMTWAYHRNIRNKNRKVRLAISTMVDIDKVVVLQSYESASRSGKDVSRSC